LGGVERVLEIAASTRVLRERRLHALGDSPCGAVLGREFVTFRGLAERCAAETGTRVRALLDSAGLTALVALCARGKGELGERLRERPGLATSLAATLRDLRDAGVPPRELPRSHEDVAATYSELERALGRLEKDGIFDRVGLFRLALRGAPDYLARRGFARIEVHGATELVGSVGDLLSAAAESLPLRFYQPDFGSPWAERLRAEWAWSFAPEASEVIADPALDPDGEIPPGALVVRRARSPRAELEGVAREVLSRIASGVAPSDIQVVARSLEPYAPWLESIFRGYGIPFTSSLRVPELAWPERRVWLDLAHAVTRDLERAAVVRVAQSLGSSLGERLAPGVAALADRIAREGAVLRGGSDWRATLRDATTPSPETTALERVITRLTGAAADMARTRDFTAAAGALRELGAELFGRASADSVGDSLASVARLDLARAAAGSVEPLGVDELGQAFDAALREPSSAPFAEDAGGVRVLDAIQARALPCRHLFAIGLVHGAWPRSLAEDPFLSDALRGELRARLRRPVPLRGLVADEDRFLLGLLLSQAREQVVLSWAESDSSGRAQSPSALLLTLPFVAPGTNVLAREPEAWETTAPELLRTAEALCAAAGHPNEREQIATRLSAHDAETLRAGLELVRQVDLPRAESLRYDAEVGDAAALSAALSPSHVELLGQCPLRAFFTRWLRAAPLEPLSPDELEANEAGNFVHDALETIYPELFAGGTLAAGTPLAVAVARARELVPAALDRIEAEQRSRVRERHPTAWAAFRATITRALVDFLERDLESLLEHGVAALATESKVEARIRAGGESLSVKGTIDRIARLENGEIRVGDYKTSRQFDRPLHASGIARGTALQIPVYALAVAEREPGAQVRGETLTVPLRPERDRDRDRDEERYAPAAELARLSQRALAALAELVRTGFFPTSNRPPDKACRGCAYTVACRVQHPQSVARIADHDSASAYFALAKERA
jgi:RecB family exonuclease